VRKTGKRTAIAATLVGTAVIIAAGIALKDLIIEEVDLWRLDSGDRATREAATARIARTCSVRGHLKLLERFRRELEEPKLALSTHLLPSPLDTFLREVSKGESRKAPFLVECLRVIYEPVRLEGAGTTGGMRSLRGLAAEKLVEIGLPAVPHLIPALSDGDEGVRIYAAWALARLPSPAALPALARATRDGHASVRRYAAQGIGRIGLERPEAVKALEKLAAADPDGEVRETAAEALGRIREKGEGRR